MSEPIWHIIESTATGETCVVNVNEVCLLNCTVREICLNNGYRIPIANDVEFTRVVNEMTGGRVCYTPEDGE